MRATSLVFAAMGLLAAGPAAAAAFQNGGFESSSSYPSAGGFTTFSQGSTALTGWTVDFGSVDYIDAGFWQPSEGNYSLDMSGGSAGTLSQTFDTVAQQAYVVTFDLSKNPGTASGVLQVSVGDPLTAVGYQFSTANSATSMNWAPQVFRFTAAGATTTLSFASLSAGFAGPALDNVAVAVEGGAPAVPEPATWAMMILGLALAGGTARRRRTAVCPA